MFMEPTMRWYGPEDQVPLSFIRQAGCTGVVTSLHQIPYGEKWSEEAIRERQMTVDKAGMTWSVVESLPVHEDIKLRRGNYREYLDNYKDSLRNLGKCGIKVVTYNFMPVLDWVRTDLHYRLPDGSEALYFNCKEFAAFELFILERAGAESDYKPEEIARAKEFFDGLSLSQRNALSENIINNFPGFKGVSLNDIRAMLAGYKDITEPVLRENLRLFLEEITPVCEEYGIVMTIHPDDPPRSILGLPRIFSILSDIKWLLSVNTSRANGVCFCSGSFSGRLDNDILAMFDACADRVGFLHLRSTEHLANGDFFEANHLEGVVDMYALVKRIIEEQLRRQVNNRSDWKIPFRPDHGHVMLDDLAKPPVANPGYSAIGRLKGLAELRGLELGIMRSIRM